MCGVNLRSTIRSDLPSPNAPRQTASAGALRRNFPRPRACMKSGMIWDAMGREVRSTGRRSAPLSN